MQERVCLHSRFVCKWDTQIITFCNFDVQHPSAVNVNANHLLLLRSGHIYLPIQCSFCSLFQII